MKPDMLSMQKPAKPKREKKAEVKSDRIVFAQVSGAIAGMRDSLAKASQWLEDTEGRAARSAASTGILDARQHDVLVGIAYETRNRMLPLIASQRRNVDTLIESMKTKKSEPDLME